VAEEVEKLSPELVIRDTAGQIQSIRYLMLMSMLLNELQKQAVGLQRQAKELHNESRKNAEQAEQIKRLSAQVADERVQIADERAQRAAFEERLSTLERTIQAKNGEGNLAAAR
jgi:hypothetical protein